MKKRIIIFFTVFSICIFLLMVKTSPNKNLTYHHLGLDSAILFSSYSMVNTERIAFPPSFLTLFLQKNKVTEDSILLGYHCKPSDTIGFKKYYQSLPVMMKNVLDQKLIGIYFFDNLLVDGFLHTVYESQNKYYIIVCNKSILNRNLSEYLSERENRRFIPSAYWITVNITDTVYNAFFYILLHECFHILDHENKISTPFDESEHYSSVKSSFITKYWRFPTAPQDSIFNHHYLIDDLYNKSENILIDSSLVVPIYTELSKGYFASYYSTANFREDVAEYLTLYYLTQHLNSTYIIEVQKADELLLSFCPFENQQLVERFNDFPISIKLLFK